MIVKFNYSGSDTRLVEVSSITDAYKEIFADAQFYVDENDDNQLQNLIDDKNIPGIIDHYHASYLVSIEILG